MNEEERPLDGENSAHEWQPAVDSDRPLPAIGPFGVENAIRNTLSLFFGNLWLIITIVVVIVAPFEIATALRADNPEVQVEVVLFYLLGAACKVLVAPALIYSLAKLIQTGTAAGVHESYRWGLSRLFKLIVCAFISAIIQGLGYVLCIIPGIIVSLAFALVYPIAVLEGGSISEIFSRSLSLTKGHRLEILVVQILLGVIIGIPAIVCGLAIVTINFWPVTVVGSIGSDVLEQVFTVLSLVMYLSLSRIPESHDYTILSLK